MARPSRAVLLTTEPCSSSRPRKLGREKFLEKPTILLPGGDTPMKKLSVLATLAVAIMFLGSRATPAHALCIHLANFCDTVQLSNDVIEGGHMFGKWDWMCVGVGTSVSGTKSAKITVGTRPVYGGYTFPYTTDFVFSKATKL